MLSKRREDQIYARTSPGVTAGVPFPACLESKLSLVKKLFPLFLLSFLLFGCADEEISPTNAIQDVYAINCIESVIQPTELVLYCADAGQILTDITWGSWGDDTATGNGKSVTNTCEPTCAEGDFVTVDVAITLYDLVASEGKLVYSKVNMVYSEPVNGVLEEIFELPITEFK